MENMKITSDTQKMTFGNNKIAFYSILNLLERNGYVNTFLMYNKEIISVLVNHDNKEYCFSYDGAPDVKEGLSINRIMKANSF